MNGWSLAGARAPAGDVPIPKVGAPTTRYIGRRRVVIGLAMTSALGAVWAAPTQLVADDGSLGEAYALINAFRSAHEQPPLAISARLQAAAQAHADDMAQHDFVAHTSSDGTDAIDRIRRFYPYNTWIGENLAAGFADAVGAVLGWQQSPRHREGLLLPEFQAIGLGLATNEQSRYRWYWVCDLGGTRDED